MTRLNRESMLLVVLSMLNSPEVRAASAPKRSAEEWARLCAGAIKADKAVGITLVPGKHRLKESLKAAGLPYLNGDEVGNVLFAHDDGTCGYDNRGFLDIVDPTKRTIGSDGRSHFGRYFDGRNYTDPASRMPASVILWSVPRKSLGAKVFVPETLDQCTALSGSLDRCRTERDAEKERGAILAKQLECARSGKNADDQGNCTGILPSFAGVTKGATEDTHRIEAALACQSKGGYFHFDPDHCERVAPAVEATVKGSGIPTNRWWIMGLATALALAVGALVFLLWKYGKVGTKLAKTAREIRELMTQLGAARLENEGLKAQLKEKRKQLADLQRDFDAAAAEYAALEQQLDATQQAFTSARGDVLDRDELIKSLKRMPIRQVENWQTFVKTVLEKLPALATYFGTSKPRMRERQPAVDALAAIKAAAATLPPPDAFEDLPAQPGLSVTQPMLAVVNLNPEAEDGRLEDLEGRVARLEELEALMRAMRVHVPHIKCVLEKWHPEDPEGMAAAQGLAELLLKIYSLPTAAVA